MTDSNLTVTVSHQNCDTHSIMGYYLACNSVIVNRLVYFFSLLVAIGLEAFNKFSQEQKEKMEEDEERESDLQEEVEEERRVKITGRFLLKGFMDMIGDSLAATNKMV